MAVDMSIAAQTKAPVRLTLLPQLGLSLLHRGDNHVANTSIRKPVEAGTETEGLDDVQRLGTAVVSAVDDCTDGETKGHAEFGTRCTSGCILGSNGHFGVVQNGFRGFVGMNGTVQQIQLA